MKNIQIRVKTCLKEHKCSILLAIVAIPSQAYLFAQPSPVYLALSRPLLITLYLDKIETTATPIITLDHYIIRDKKRDRSGEVIAYKCLYDTPGNDSSLNNRRFVSRLQIGRRKPALLEWYAADTAWTVTYPGVVLHLHTRVTPLTDPALNDTQTDPDRDGISNKAEARLARFGLSIGDPTRREAILVVTHTHPKWALSLRSKDLLTTVFREHGIWLHVLTEPGEMRGFASGPLRLYSKKPRKRRKAQIDHALATEKAGLHIQPHYAGFAYFLALARKVGDDGDFGYFGISSFENRNLVVRSQLKLGLGKNWFGYQVKTVMHEFGHNLGLCHPTQSDDNCPSGPVPAGERHPGKTVMGTPAEDKGRPFRALKHALQRPLDYSPAQWKNIWLIDK